MDPKLVTITLITTYAAFGFCFGAPMGQIILKHKASPQAIGLEPVGALGVENVTVNSDKHSKKRVSEDLTIKLDDHKPYHVRKCSKYSDDDNDNNFDLEFEDEADTEVDILDLPSTDTDYDSEDFSEFGMALRQDPEHKYENGEYNGTNYWINRLLRDEDEKSSENPLQSEDCHLVEVLSRSVYRL